MDFLKPMRSWLSAHRVLRKGKRVRCRDCREKVLPSVAKRNSGLCRTCFRITHPLPKRDPKDSPYHRNLDTPAGDLTDDQKRNQLSGAIRWGNERRIDELFSAGTEFLNKPAEHSLRTWLGDAIFVDCSLSILKKLVAVGCDVNAFLASDKSKSRPLGIAINKERIDVVEWLLGKGADPNLGRPLVSAINYKLEPDVQMAMLTLLLDAGADINRTFALFGDEEKRFTTLDWAELYGVSPEVIEYLKSKGAKKQWTDKATRSKKKELKHRRIV